MGTRCGLPRAGLRFRTRRPAPPGWMRRGPPVPPATRTRPCSRCPSRLEDVAGNARAVPPGSRYVAADRPQRVGRGPRLGAGVHPRRNAALGFHKLHRCRPELAGGPRFRASYRRPFGLVAASLSLAARGRQSRRFRSPCRGRSAQRRPLRPDRLPYGTLAAPPLGLARPAPVELSRRCVGPVRGRPGLLGFVRDVFRPVDHAVAHPSPITSSDAGAWPRSCRRPRSPLGCR